MRHFSAQLGLILINAMWATRLLAADAVGCTGCAVADAIATALPDDDRSHAGLHAGGGYWLLSAQFDDLETASIGGPARLRNDSNGSYLLAQSPRVPSHETSDDDLF